MQCKVFLQCKKGRFYTKNRYDKKGSEIIGDLNVATFMHPVLYKVVTEATLTDKKGNNLIEPIFDVKLCKMGAWGFTLSGIEYSTGVRYGQEWWCIPVAEKGKYA
ncbi:MAG: hypothetical protein PHQ91_15920 [Thermoanaerobaculaceae bacterium]|nr:hypothetical protein [Thermoanaerobaculaceae bacterium]